MDIEVVRCHVCETRGTNTLHSDIYSKCPVCGAGTYWQNFASDSLHLPEDHPLVIEMRIQERVRAIEKALEGADDEVMKRVRQRLVGL